jgi:hypothetical protein
MIFAQCGALRAVIIGERRGEESSVHRL